MLNELSVIMQNLTYRFNNGKEFSLRINELTYHFNGPLGLYGLSGSGKTTFSKLLAGILTPGFGTVSFSMKNRGDKPKIIYSPQFPENVLLGVQVGDTIQQYIVNESTGSVGDSIRTYLKKFSLNYNEIKNKNGYELSGGELRRLAIALSLSLLPDLLILDEPTIGLGFQGKLQLYALLEEFSQKHHIMIVSHDFSLIQKICRDFWILHNGNLIFSGDLASLEMREDIKTEVGINSLDNYLNKYLASKEVASH